jgi:hypothetical protein
MSFKSDIGVAFTGRRNMEHFECAKFLRCIGGKGYKIIDQHKFMGLDAQGRQTYVITENNSWMFNACALNHCIDYAVSNDPPVISMNGIFHPKHFTTEMETSEKDFASIYDTFNFSGQAIFTVTNMFPPVDDGSTSSILSFQEKMSNRIFNGYCCITTHSHKSGIYENKIEEGNHVLGYQLPYVNQRDNGEVDIIQYDEITDLAIQYTKNGKAHETKRFKEQNYQTGF